MEMEEEKVATDKRILVMVLPHPLIKHWSFVLRNEQTSSTIFEDDVTFKLEYVHPYLDGVQSPRNRTFRASCFNSRKMSPIFISGPDADEVPPVCIDRAGIKGIITESSLKP